MNLASIITLLQLVLALLSNPTTANNPQIQALANQAITAATASLNQLSSNSSPISSAPQQIQQSTRQLPVPTSTASTLPEGTIDTNNPISNPQSCTLSMSAQYQSSWNGIDSSVVRYSWKLVGAIDPKTKGKLRSLSTYQGDYGPKYTEVIMDPNNNPGMLTAYVTNPPSGGYEADFGGTKCYTYLPQLNPWTYGSSTIIYSSPNPIP